MPGLAGVGWARWGRGGSQLVVSTAVFLLAVGPLSKLVAAPLSWQLVHIGSVGECIVLRPVGWELAASCPSGDRSPLAARDMVGAPLVVEARTCCRRLVVLGRVDFGRIGSSARLLRRRFVLQTVLALGPEPGLELGLLERVAC